MSEEDGAYSMSVKHFLIVSNSAWTQQPFALLALLYTSMDTAALRLQPSTQWDRIKRSIVRNCL